MQEDNKRRQLRTLWLRVASRAANGLKRYIKGRVRNSVWRRTRAAIP